MLNIDASLLLQLVQHKKKIYSKTNKSLCSKYNITHGVAENVKASQIE